MKTYQNAVGTASPSVTDTTAFADCADPAPVSCVPSERTICLGADGRFQAEVAWRNTLGQDGPARQAVLPTPGFAESDDSGLFYFFTVEKCFGAPTHFGMSPQKAVEEFIRLLRYGLLPRLKS